MPALQPSAGRDHPPDRAALAARRVGMSPDALHDWFRADDAFKQAAETAGADLGAGLVERIADAGKRGDWRAGAYLLDRHPATLDEFSPRPTEGAQGVGPILIQFDAPGFTGRAYREALRGHVGETHGAAAGGRTARALPRNRGQRLRPDGCVGHDAAGEAPKVTSPPVLPPNHERDGRVR